MSKPDFIQQFTGCAGIAAVWLCRKNPMVAAFFWKATIARCYPSSRSSAAIFPNLWNFPGFEQTCCAFPRLVGEEEFPRRIALIKLKDNHG